MAAVPELTSEKMNCSGKENDQFFEEDGPKQMKGSFQDPDLSSVGNGALMLQISHQLYNKTFKHAASIIVAVEKLKKIPSPCSQAFQDDDLRSLFSFIFEEEPIICDKQNDTYQSNSAVESLDIKLEDIEEKAMVLSGSCVLKAVHLQRTQEDQQVVFCMSFVQGEEETNKIPVALGLKGKNLYLSCGMKDGKPILQLESVKPNTYPKRKMEKRFVFNKLEINHKCEFESAMYPNWYISTSRSELQPIFLGNTRSSENITDFIMELA
ncbi:interleukin-1 beta-like [Diceros bicornis minor]|uniref:interleukin-1 beta-like n=1 Tax=Diceros bicornis minor TaxID=77932 RepID=UPI0026EEB7D7|nr:interleukin-1 beta-like [Diceros bicornis minor]